MRPLHFLLNPQAGRGRATAAWAQIESNLRSAGSLLPSGGYTLSEISDESYDFSAISKESVLVAVGGDGSVHHAAELALQHNLALGIIPAGTGNDYASELNLPLKPLAALERIVSGITVSLDVLRVNDQLVVNAGGFGLDASVVHFIERHRWLKRFGTLGYTLSLPVVLGRYHPYEILVRVGHTLERFDNVSLVAVTNGPAFGGGMRVVPDADPCDGQMELCVVSNLSKPALLGVFPQIFRGSHVNHPSVRIFRGNQFEFELLRSNQEAQLDGEPAVVENRIRVRLEPGRLRVMGANRSARGG